MATCTPPFTGLVPASGQSLVSQSLGWYNITDFAAGFATGHTTDVTKWVQESINLAQNDQMTLYFPPRPYLISSGLVISAPCTLIGIDSGTGFKQNAGGDVTGCGSATFVTRDNRIEMLCITSNDVVVENFDFVTIPDTHTNPNGRAIHLYEVERVRISNVTAYGPWDGVLIDSSSDITLEDITVIPFSDTTSGRYGFKADGATLSGQAGTANLLRCTVDQTQYPFNDGGSPTYHTVDGFVADNGYQGFTCTLCSVLGAAHGFVSQMSSGAAYDDVNDFRILASKAYNCNVGILLTEGQAAIVEDCYVPLDLSASAPTATPVIGIDLASTYSGGPVTMSNNVIAGNASASMIGISLVGGTQASVCGGAITQCGPNTLGSSNGYGISFAAPLGSSYTIDGVVIRGCSQAGLHVATHTRVRQPLAHINVVQNTNSNVWGPRPKNRFPHYHYPAGSTRFARRVALLWPCARARRDESSDLRPCFEQSTKWATRTLEWARASRPTYRDWRAPAASQAMLPA